MSDLIKQLETIGQNAARRNETLEVQGLQQLSTISGEHMKAVMFAPDDNPGNDN